MKRKAINEEDGCVLKQNYNRHARMNRVLQTKPRVCIFQLRQSFQDSSFQKYSSLLSVAEAQLINARFSSPSWFGAVKDKIYSECTRIVQIDIFLFLFSSPQFPRADFRDA